MLTASSIDALKHGAIHDPQTPGLSIVAKKGGRKLWRYRRRVVGDGKILDIHLGTYPAHSIGAAREWASGLNAKVEAGIDPRVETREEEERRRMILRVRTDCT